MSMIFAQLIVECVTPSILFHGPRVPDLSTSLCLTRARRKIYQHVIEKERKGDYLGKTVQVCFDIVHHFTAEETSALFILASSSLTIRRCTPRERK